jgi:hypothetical protein
VADDHGGPMSPARAFAVCAALVATAGVLGLSTRPDRLRSPASARAVTSAASAAGVPVDTRRQGSSVSSPPGRPDAVFKRLRAGLNHAVRLRSLRRLRSVTTVGPVRRRGAQVIRNLLGDEVIEGTRLVTTDVRVVRALPARLVIAERVTLYPCFRSESGRDITRAPARVAQRGVWILSPSRGRWRLRAARINRERVMDADRARCR